MLFEAFDEGLCLFEKTEHSGLPDLRFIEANPAFMRQLGLMDVVGRTVRELMPDECDAWIEACERVAQAGKAMRREHRVTDQERVLELQTFPVGKAQCRFGVSLKDVTDIRRSEDQWRHSSEAIANLMDNAPFGLYVVDAALSLCHVNKAARAVFVHVELIAHRPIGEVLREVWTEPFVSEALARFRHTLATGEPHAASGCIQARQDRAKVEYYDWQIERVTLPDGQFGVACYFYDITAREQVEETLRQSEQRFRALFDRGPVAVYCVDATGAIQEFNAVAAQFWGQAPSRADATGRFCGAYGLYLPDGTPLPHEQTPIVKVLAGELPAALDAEMVIERSDGSRLSVVANIVPLHDSQGNISGAINCFYDITERKRLQEEIELQAAALEDQHRRKDEFLAMLGHELRNPLAPIMNAVHLLDEGADGAPAKRKARDVIERQVRQLKLLVDELLEVSRISSGRVQLQRTPVTLRSVLERAIETVQPMTTQRQHEVIVSVPLQEVWLHADGPRMEQVLVNLLTNASKYSDVVGFIWVTAHVEGPTLVLSVRDAGIGIPAELLPRVFDLFTQAERSLDRSQGGLGVGLCLVQRLVELHGGTVQARSVLGEGSEFIVRLPVISSPLAPSSAMPAVATDAASGSSRLRVLVVDDNVDAADTLRDLVVQAGHEVDVANDGNEALAAVDRFRPHVVLLDIGLPGVSGLEVARQVRARAASSHVVLVAMTGYGHQADRDLTSSAGFDHHLVKPTFFEDVQKILDLAANSGDHTPGP